MLKRNDLVKEFEHLVKQEIKNHNDSILATNLAINHINSVIDDLCINLNEKINSLKNEDQKNRNLHKKECEKHEENVNEIKRDLSKSKNEFKELCEILNKEISKKKNTSKSDSDIEIIKENVKKEIEDLKTKINETQGIIERNIDSKINSLFIHIQAILELIKNCNNEYIKLQKQLDEILNFKKLEKDSFTREIEVLKKQNFINEKKIEDIYKNLKSR